MQSIWSAKIFGDRADPRARLHALFGGARPAGGQPPEAALAWANETPARAGGGARADVGKATRALRSAAPRLPPRGATFLSEPATRDTLR